MLVLARKQGESILIGENIRLKVIAVRGGTVVLGFEAPRSIPIVREEIASRGPRVPQPGEIANE